MKRFDEALNILGEIETTSYQNEGSTILQVISYNKASLNDNKNHIQSFFIIGLILYKKLNKPIQAYEYFEKFLQFTKENKEWKVLSSYCEKQLDQINELIGTKNSC